MRSFAAFRHQTRRLLIDLTRCLGGGGALIAPRRASAPAVGCWDRTAAHLIVGAPLAGGLMFHRHESTCPPARSFLDLDFLRLKNAVARRASGGWAGYLIPAP